MSVRGLKIIQLRNGAGRRRLECGIDQKIPVDQGGVARFKPCTKRSHAVAYKVWVLRTRNLEELTVGFWPCSGIKTVVDGERRRIGRDEDVLGYLVIPRYVRVNFRDRRLGIDGDGLGRRWQRRKEHRVAR